ncbi:MAG: glycosyltransferase family 4 protein, partial [Desulforhabdus sp.]|nr:glycosyltransferase family 4 protein [Desulforhabdus sp.]
MKILIALFKYFPWGGLQKDTLRFAQEAVRRGHQATILTTDWIGSRPDEDISIEIMPVRALANHRAVDKFARCFLDYRCHHSYDISLAMSRIPGADFYFVADSCMASWMPKKHSHFILKTMPRFRTYLAHERAICSPLSPTRLLYIASPQKDDFLSAYQLPEERFIYLPPGMDPRCQRPDNAEHLRQQKRIELRLANDAIMLIQIGTNIWRKGFDRVLVAIAALPENLRNRVRFFLAGNDKPEKVRKVAQAHGVADSVTFLGPRDDVHELLLAADIMVHPAREEGAGNVLIEGLVAGLPVICSAACGFGSFVNEATQTVVPEPFAQQNLNSMLEQSLAQLPKLAARTIAYAKPRDFCARDRVVVDAIEALAVQKEDLDLPTLYNCRPTDNLLRARNFNRPENGFSTMAYPEGRWTFLARFPLDKLRDILVVHQQICSAGKWLKNDHKRRVTRVHCHGQSFVVKEFCTDYVLNYFNHGRRTWESSQRLRGFTAPCLGWLRDNENRSFLIFADLGEMNLWHESHVQHENLSCIYWAAGQLMAELHGNGIYHADAKTTNFVINDLCPWLPRPTLIIDCDDVRLYRVLPLARRTKNLAQFLATTGVVPAE